jgi:PAS domain S-box-containing protein
MAVVPIGHSGRRCRHQPHPPELSSIPDGAVDDVNVEMQARMIDSASAVIGCEAALDAIPDLVAILGTDYSVLRANRALGARLGVDPASLVGHPCYEVIHGASEPPEYCPFTRLLANGEEAAVELWEPRLDGCFAATTSPIREPDGTIAGAVLVARDITESKRTESRLAESEGLYRQFIDATDDFVFLKDEHGRHVIANEALSSFFQLPRDEVIGKDDRQLMPGRGAATCARTDRQALAGEGVRVFVESVGDRAFETRKFPVSLGDGRVGVGGFVRDVSERKHAEQALAESADRLQRTLEGIVTTLAAVVESRDPYTAGHQRRVATLARAIGEELRLDAATISGLQTAAWVHDIGKITVPSEILSKPGRLGEPEWQLVQQHAVSGERLLAAIEFERPIATIVGQHHERLDGSGYPRGLRGGEILLESRIIAVADVTEAMASHRPYRPALPVEEVVRELEDNAGTRYDADVCSACLRLLRSESFTFPA